VVVLKEIAMYVELKPGMSDAELRAVLNDFGGEPCLLCGGPPSILLAA
jgi:hypothetical protein